MHWGNRALRPHKPKTGRFGPPQARRADLFSTSTNLHQCVTPSRWAGSRVAWARQGWGGAAGSGVVPMRGVRVGVCLLVALVHGLPRLGCGEGLCM